MFPAEEFAGQKVAIIEPDRFGGTCLNRGCIPTKMFVVTADLAHSVKTAARLGVHASLEGVDWTAVQQRIFGRIDPLHERAVDYRRNAGIDVYTQPARFVAAKVIDVGGELLSADVFIVASGARPVIPPIPGLDSVPFYTSDSIMRIDAAPESLVIIGGGFIAAEFGHVFDAFGSKVTIVQSGPRLLMAEDEDVSQRFTDLAGKRHVLLLDSVPTAVAAGPEGIRVDVEGTDGSTTTVEGQALLIAAGRRSNTDLIDAQAGGLDIDDRGRIRADRAGRTAVPGVWALGDATSHLQLKHLANAEGRVVWHNVRHPDDLRYLPQMPIPHAVFSDPQIASFGVTEQAARAQSLNYMVSTRAYADAAYGWALEDTTGFVKILADPTTRTLLGTHIIGPQASTLIQPLLQASMLGQTVDQLAHDVLYIHPALTELLEQALLDLHQ